MELPKPPPARMSSSAAKRAGEWDRLLSEIRACRTPEELAAWRANEARFETLPASWSDGIEDAVIAQAERLVDHLIRQD